MNNKEEGFILIDTIIALLILSLTLTSTYDLIIKSFKFEDKMTEHVSQLLNRSENYDESYKEIF